MTRRTLPLLYAFLLVACCAAAPALAQTDLTPDAAFKLLQEGNTRYVAGVSKQRNYFLERAELISGQKPYAVVLTCSDSRVPPELIFDESLGRLFVVRVAGNVADPVVLGSIEYAVTHLHATAVLVLGHRSCGAVKATIEGEHVPANVMAIAGLIKPAVDKVRADHTEAYAELDHAIAENVRVQMSRLVKESSVIALMAHAGAIQVRGAVYELGSGKIDFIKYTPPGSAVASEPAQAPKISQGH